MMVITPFRTTSVLHTCSRDLLVAHRAYGKLRVPRWRYALRRATTPRFRGKNRPHLRALPDEAMPAPSAATRNVFVPGWQCSRLLQPLALRVGGALGENRVISTIHCSRQLPLRSCGLLRAFARRLEAEHIAPGEVFRTVRRR